MRTEVGKSTDKLPNITNASGADFQPDLAKPCATLASNIVGCVCRVGKYHYVLSVTVWEYARTYHAVVKVFAAQMGIASCGAHFKHGTLGDGQDADVEGATAQVEDEDVLFALHLLIQPIGQSGSRRFVDDAQHIQAGNLPRVLRRLTL